MLILIAIIALILLVITSKIENWLFTKVKCHRVNQQKYQSEENSRRRSFDELHKYLEYLNFNIIHCGGRNPIRMYGWLPSGKQFYVSCKKDTCYMVVDDDDNDSKKISCDNASNLSEPEFAMIFVNFLEQYGYHDLAKEIKRVY